MNFNFVVSIIDKIIKILSINFAKYWIELLYFFILYLVLKVIFQVLFVQMRKLPKFYRKEIIITFLFTRNTVRVFYIFVLILRVMVLIGINISPQNSFYNNSIFFAFVCYIFRVSLLLVKYFIGIYAELEIEQNPSSDRYKIRTFMRISEQCAKIVIICIFALTIFYLLGISIPPLISAVGFVAGGLSFAGKTLITDIINGMFILHDNSLKIGDWIDFEGKTAMVEDMQLRYIRIRLDDGMLITIPFHEITIIKNKTRQYSYIVLNISFNINTDMLLAEKAVQEAFVLLKNKPEFKYKILKDIEVRDLADMTGFSFVMQYRICTEPQWQNKIRRAFNKELKIIFQKHDIHIATPMVSNVISVPSITTADSYPDFY